jgi:hypothetical protein
MASTCSISSRGSFNATDNTDSIHEMARAPRPCANPLMMTLISLMILAVSTVAWAESPARAQDCREWQECRQLALDAAARQDYNAFHDLAWRTLQAGPKNDAALMTMLARAQSLSGRPHDALVMLRRLAAMGVVTDAATSDDFSRVRALPGWAELEASAYKKTSGMPPPESVASAPPVTASPRAKREPSAAETPSVDPAKEKPAKAETATVEPKTKAAARAPAPLIFSASGLGAVGLGYDAVSGRFIVGDRNDRRLLVVGERSGRVASLAGVDAGFDEVSAFEIDAVEGDLWVVSSSSQSRSSTLHKLQLISGRVLTSIPLSPEEGPGRFTDVAVTPQSILVLDGEGRRVYRVAKKGRTLEMVVRLAAPECSSLAPASDGSAYLAYDRGILRVDLTTRAMTVVEPAPQTSLEGLRWIRWHRGSLIAIQGDLGGPFRLLRIRLDDLGRRVKTIDVLVGNVALAGPTSATLSGGAVYYLSPASPLSNDQVEVKKLPLK